MMREIGSNHYLLHEDNHLSHLLTMSSLWIEKGTLAILNTPPCRSGKSEQVLNFGGNLDSIQDFLTDAC